jgi:PAS domain S-box-containing protein
VLYYLFARVGSALTVPGTNVGLVWPSAGIALALMLRYGYGVWPGIALGAIASNAPGILAGHPVWADFLLLVGGETLADVVPTMLATRWLGGPSRYRDPHASATGVIRFVILGAGASQGLSAIMGLLVLWAGGIIPRTALAPVGLTWWISNTVSVLMVTPFLLVWQNPHLRPRVARLPLHLAAWVLSALGTYVAFRWSFPGTHHRLEYLLFLVVVPSPFLLGPGGAPGTTLAVGATAVLCTASGMGPFLSASPTISILLLGMYLGVLALTGLLLAGLISDRDRNLARIEASEAEYRSLVNTVPDLIFTFNRQGDYLSVNTSSADLLLCPPQEVVGRNAAEVLPGPVADLLVRTLAVVLETGTVQEMDYILDFPGGERYFEARLAPSAGDRVIAQKLDSLGRLAGGIAHDLNNVLGAILGIASANQGQYPPGSPMHRAFDTITRAAARGGQTVRNLLNFARQSPITSQSVDFNLLIQEMTQLLERTTLATVRVDLDLQGDLRPVLGDPAALSTTLMNLAVNAVDAMNGEGTLFLRTRNLGPGRVEVEVGDSGPGMDPEVLQKAMDPFFTTKETGKGTGLGLSIAYSTVKAHQGEMDLRSEPGKGTWVSLRFPGI